MENSVVATASFVTSGIFIYLFIFLYHTGENLLKNKYRLTCGEGERISQSPTWGGGKSPRNFYFL